MVFVVALLVALASVGASMPSPVASKACAPGVAIAPVLCCTPPSLQAVAHPQAVNISNLNLRMPRAPRHRSERPTSGLTDAEAVTAASVLKNLVQDVHRPFVIDSASAFPLAGHPLSLLRPPSLSAAC